MGGYDRQGGLVRTLLAMLLLLASPVVVGTAWAKEPASGKWTQVRPRTLPDHVVHYATISESQARELLARADVSLLYDRDQELDLIPGGALVMESFDRLATRDRFRVEPVPDELGGGYGLFDLRRRGPSDDGRVDTPEAPVERVQGLPVRARQGAGLTPYDPFLVEFGDIVFVGRMVTLRVRDPLDPSREIATARLATAAVYQPTSVLPEPRETYRQVLTFRLGDQAREDPRVVYLPIDAQGELDPSRDGVVVRLEVTGARVDAWTTELDEALVPVAVRLHFGDAESLEAHLDSLPPLPRERFVEPGGPDDPLLLGPRSPRAPLGAGVQARVGIEGRITVLAGTGLPPGDTRVRPHMSPFEADGWYGRAAFGVTASPELLGVGLGLHTGSLRDTDSTTLLAEIGVVPAGYISRPGAIAASFVLRARRRSRSELLGQPLEVGSDLRVGTLGITYRAVGGIRIYTDRGLVLTPSAYAGFRYAANRQIGEGLVGIVLDAAWNRNVFRGRSEREVTSPSAGRSTEAPPPDPDDRASDPPAP